MQMLQFPQNKINANTSKWNSNTKLYYSSEHDRAIISTNFFLFRGVFVKLWKVPFYLIPGVMVAKHRQRVFKSFFFYTVWDGRSWRHTDALEVVCRNQIYLRRKKSTSFYDERVFTQRSRGARASSASYTTQPSELSRVFSNWWRVSGEGAGIPPEAQRGTEVPPP